MSPRRCEGLREEPTGEPWGFESGAEDCQLRRPGPVRRLLGYARRLLPLGARGSSRARTESPTSPDEAEGTEDRPTDRPHDRTDR